MKKEVKEKWKIETVRRNRMICFLAVIVVVGILWYGYDRYLEWKDMNSGISDEVF